MAIFRAAFLGQRESESRLRILMTKKLNFLHLKNRICRQKIAIYLTLDLSEGVRKDSKKSPLKYPGIRFKSQLKQSSMEYQIKFPLAVQKSEKKPY
jgi:hypothetical protein